MHQTRYNKAHNNQPTFLRSVFTYFIAFIVGFSVLTSQAFALQNKKNEFQNTDRSISAISSDETSNHDVQPFKLPFASGPATEQENEDENESEDDLDNTWTGVIRNPFHEARVIPDSQFKKLTALSFAVEHRSTVSFFILYHSWKSFL